MFQSYFNHKFLKICTSCTFYTYRHQQQSVYRLKNLVNNSLSLAVGFIAGILFSPRQCTCSEYLYVINIVHLVLEINLVQ